MIIAICGFQGAGKDTIADILIKNYGFIKLSFAGAVKDIASIVFGWDREMLEGSTPESRKIREIVDPWWAEKLQIPNLSPRYVLQYFGTDLFRNHFHRDIWLRIIERKLNSHPNIVITDCRFPNEIQLMKSYEAKLINVRRGEMPEWFDDYANGIDRPEVLQLHSSETSWIREKFDHIITNDQTIDELKDKIECLLLSDFSYDTY
jgi:hypothetical protein